MTFIYVFDNETKELLLESGFKLFQSDDLNKVFVFLNDPEIELPGFVTEYVITDSLTL